MTLAVTRAPQRFQQRTLRVGVCALLAVAAACERPAEKAARHKHDAAAIAVSAVPAKRSAPARLRQAFERECGSLAASGCDLRAEACQERLFELSQCLFGKQGPRPPLLFISEELSRRKRMAAREHASDSRTELEQVLHALGLGRAVEAADGAADAEGLGANAYYAPAERVVYLVADTPDAYASEPTRLLVGHEYVHALQDARGELLAAQAERKARTFDRQLALWSGFEGEATLYEEVMRALLHERGATWVSE